ncbi:MAG: rhodanese-like domain-containing protein [Sediminibacterium sp.]
MLAIIKNILGIAPAIDFHVLLKNGAQIIDVRTPSEYKGGHIKGSINIPLDQLQQQFSKISVSKPIITCCASGMRSASAKQLLTAKGFTEVHNGGGWTGLQNKLR